MVIRVTGTWTARVQQDFEVEVESDDEVQAAIEAEMNPRNVVELLDFDYTIDETHGGDE